MTTEPTTPPADASVIPYQLRRVLYLIATVVLLALTAWQASEGNVTVAVVTFLTSLTQILAAANASPTQPLRR